MYHITGFWDGILLVHVWFSTLSFSYGRYRVYVMLLMTDLVDFVLVSAILFRDVNIGNIEAGEQKWWWRWWRFCCGFRPLWLWSWRYWLWLRLHDTWQMLSVNRSSIRRLSDRYLERILLWHRDRRHLERILLRLDTDVVVAAFDIKAQRTLLRLRGRHLERRRRKMMMMMTTAIHPMYNQNRSTTSSSRNLDRF